MSRAAHRCLAPNERCGRLWTLKVKAVSWNEDNWRCYTIWLPNSNDLLHMLWFVEGNLLLCYLQQWGKRHEQAEPGFVESYLFDWKLWLASMVYLYLKNLTSLAWTDWPRRSWGTHKLYFLIQIKKKVEQNRKYVLDIG